MTVFFVLIQNINYHFRFFLLLVSNYLIKHIPALTAFLLLALASVEPVLADSFGAGANTFDIDFVPIGNPGNPPYSVAIPAGSVPYHYRMGKFEISEQMIDKANAQSALEGNPLGITKDTRGPDKPATSITWYEAAMFANWLNTSTNNAPAYKFDGNGTFQLWEPEDSGYDSANLYRNSLAKYVLPSLDEWYKAAYYDPNAGVWYDYPTCSNDIPDGIDFAGDPDFEAVFFDGGANTQPNDVTDVGLLSPYGTTGQGGNVFEWDETAFDRHNTYASQQRAVLGGSWVTASNVLAAFHSGGGTTPQFEINSIGFRIANVPEPSTALLLGMGVLGLSRRFWAKKG